jgi:type IV pilus assembly protein PilW
MVALVITLILLAGIGQIFLSSKKSFVIQNSLGRIQENGRYAMDVVVSDLRRAGYWGGNADIAKIEGTQGTNLGADEECTNEANWSHMLDRSIYGLNLSGSQKPSDGGNNYSCIKDAGATPYVRGDVLLVRYAHPSAVGSITKPLSCASGTTIAECYPDEYFLRSSLFRGRLFKGSDSELTDNNLVAPAIRTAELVARAYYIGTSNRPSACPADGAVPSLVRICLDSSGAFTAGEVAYGVDNLQIKYGIESSNGGIRYYDADEIEIDPSPPPTTTPPTPPTPDWKNVVVARIWLLIRAECPETGFTNSNTYVMGDVNYTPTDTDGRGYRRKLYTSTIQLRNSR